MHKTLVQDWRSVHLSWTLTWFVVTNAVATSWVSIYLISLAAISLWLDSCHSGLKRNRELWINIKLTGTVRELLLWKNRVHYHYIYYLFCLFYITSFLWDGGFALPASPPDLPHSVTLEENKYSLYWTFDDESITFETHTKTNGYVGFGVSPSGGMPGADVVIGWVKDSEVFFHVSYG